MARAKKSVQEKVDKEYPEFVTEVAGATVDQLNDRLAALARGLEESEDLKEEDQALENAKALALELSGPYKDVKKAVQLKTKYIYGLLKDKGAV